MVHVMKDEKQRRQHCASFQRSFRSGMSSASCDHSHSHSSLAGPHTSALLEQMCASIIGLPSDGGFDDLLRDEDHNCYESFATSTVDQMTLGNDDHRSHMSEDLAKSLADLLPIPKSIHIHDKSNKAASISPIPLKSILRTHPPPRSPSSPTTPSEYDRPPHFNLSMPGPPRRRRVYTASSDNAQDSPAAALCPANDIRLTKSCVVRTKKYDGHKREFRRQLSRSFTIPSKGSQTKQSNDDDQSLQSNLVVNNCNKVVSHMVWAERIAPHRNGVYSGAVDHKMRPHGIGSFEVKEGGVENEKQSGYWYKGLFTSNTNMHVRKYTDADCKKSKSHGVMEKEQDLMRGCPPPPPFSVPTRADDKSSSCQAKRNEDQTNTSGDKKKGLEQCPAENAQSQLEPDKHQALPYKLGDKLQSIDETINRRANGGRTHLEAICHLKPKDGAFVKRTDRSYTFAVVIKRYLDPRHEEEMLLFALNSKGSTKIVPRRQWKSCIRALAPRKEYSHQDSSSISPRSMNLGSPRSVKENINASPTLRREESQHSTEDSVTEHWA